MQIVQIIKSPRQGKRYRIFLDDNSYYDFGLLGASTYLEHKDETKRINYWKRHYSNEKEQELIDKLIPSPALFSAYLLWGFHTDIVDNINYLNRILKLKQ